ncbi:hypothetical protein LCGC14_0503160 [marine sediment metagenome]|uniref:Uncharacterized protein n=2 Tax=root TaxID=1 RepID=A0A0F9S3D8_9ZZZZ
MGVVENMVEKRSDLPNSSNLPQGQVASAMERDAVYGLIGKLVCTWSNNESVLSIVLMHLLKTDRAGAILVFGTLNTTRARIDMIRRLAKTRLGGAAELARRLEKLMGQFERSTRTRNDFLHSMFVFDTDGCITHTQTMRIDERKGQVRYGTYKPVDATRLAYVADEIEKLTAWNHVIWSLLPELEEHMTGETGLSADDVVETQ